MFIVSWFVLAVFCLSLVKCELCDVADHDCTTKGANSNFGPFINGTDNIVEASDPLRVDLIEDSLPTISYKLTNASFSGMKECVVKSLKVNKEALSFLFNFECPRIVIKTDYEVKGTIITLYVEGKGILTVTADDNVYMFNGEYEKTIGEDNKQHAQIKSYNVYVDPRGKVVFNITNLFGGDKEKSDIAHNFINANWKTVDKRFHTPTINKFMKLFIDNLNTFLKAVPIENVLPSK